jgi:hypothetical protein
MKAGQIQRQACNAKCGAGRIIEAPFRQCVGYFGEQHHDRGGTKVEDPYGMLIDLDLAKEVGSGSSEARHRRVYHAVHDDRSSGRQVEYLST